MQSFFISRRKSSPILVCFLVSFALPVSTFSYVAYVIGFFAYFNHLYIAAVRKEIQDETDRETGRSKAISSVPIHLSIYSPKGEEDTTQSLFFFFLECHFLNFYHLCYVCSCQLDTD